MGFCYWTQLFSVNSHSGAIETENSAAVRNLCIY